MARKAQTSTRAPHTTRRNSKKPSSIPSVAHFPVPITADSLRPKPTPKHAIVPDYFGPGQPGSFYFLPTPVNRLIEIGDADTIPDLAKKVRERLFTSIVKEDGSPLMSLEEWGELDFDRLMEMNAMFGRAVREDKEKKPKNKASRGQGASSQDTDGDADDDDSSNEVLEGNG